MPEKTEMTGNPMARENPIGGAIISLVEAHSRLASDKLRTIGLYRGQEMILKACQETPNCSQQDLVHQLSLDHSTIAKSVARMEKNQLLRRKKSTIDRRVTIVEVTPEGNAVLVKAEAIWQELEATARQQLTPEESQLFVELALKIVGNLKQANRDED